MNDPSDIHSISSNIVEGIFEFPDSDGSTLWIGTQGGGLCQFDKGTGEFTIYTKKDGLPVNRVLKIIADPKGNLWLAADWNICMFDTAKKMIKYFEASNELPASPFACLIDHEGELFFGGYRGLVRFYPDSMKDNSYVSDPVLTDLKINYKPAELDTVITEKKSIVLAYQQNYLSFEFAALDFYRPELYQYAYKMEGADKDWVFTDATRRYATYTNLDPGKYIFRIKCANNNGVWNEQGTSVRIIITPPWWRTGWAYVLYALILGSIVVGLWRFQVRRIQIRSELKMKSFETQKLQEIDSMKSRFFANISHEFRTPLTLILGPINKILTKTRNQEIKQELNIMQRNAQRLQRLINQLLDLSKIEAGKMTLQARPENIVALLNRIVQSFESQAKLKGIELKFQSEQDEIIAFIDRDKIENIFYNLLSNALKFTSQGGNVAVVCKIQFVNRKSEIVIAVADTGIGIPPNRLDKIFNRFYQVDDSYTREHEGSGIGLALTRELVDLHHGKIEVESELNKGTTFRVYLPLGKEHLKPEEIAADQSASADSEPAGGLHIEEPSKDSDSTRSDLRHSEGFAPPSHRKALPLVLIVEDNRDMRSYMQDCLASDYRVIEAVDGEDGLHRAIDKIPDLIISDVMMPRMDGFEMCGRLKSDERTSHIPIILLTARASAESKIKGLELGADDYLIKPFDRTELLVRAKNLIEQRRKLRERFSRDISLQPKEIAVTSYDEKFLQRTMDIIEQHLADSEFTIDSLLKEVGMSRMQLHRKLRALINCSASEFIRVLRLKRAAQLLQQKSGNVTEVAFEVGFNNLSYFSRCFRQQFGKLPSEYTPMKN
jgi:signal transduction histidine kinase/DNA-binding response OmpR family regulator